MSDDVKRPWCHPCRAENRRCWAEFLGIACEWHWGILSAADQQALREAVNKRHPRGGRVRNVLQQIAVVRMDLRSGDNTVEATWAADQAEVEAAWAVQP